MGNCLLVCRMNAASCIEAPATNQNPTALERLNKTYEKTGSVKRIRLIITKQQLRQLLSEVGSIYEVQSLVDRVTLDGFGSKLECIPEGEEYC